MNFFKMVVMYLRIITQKIQNYIQNFVLASMVPKWISKRILFIFLPIYTVVFSFYLGRTGYFIVDVVKG